MTGRARWVRTCIGAVALAALMLAIVIPSALAVGGKVFRADFDSAPDPIPAGATATVTLTISNDASPQKLGSSDITAPSGHAVTEIVSIPEGASAAIASPSLIELRDLNLPAGQQAVIQFRVTTPCQAGTYAWSLDAKQANNHSGDPGNDFVLDVVNSDLTTDVFGQCQLAFARQPADAEKAPTTITSVARDPAGLPVQVEVRSADGLEAVAIPELQVDLAVDVDPCGKMPLTLAGGSATTDASGEAEFPGLSLDQSCLGYTLRASSSGYADGTSDAFDILDDVQTCSSGSSCTAEVPGQASITTTGPEGGYAQLAISAESVIDCPEYSEAQATMITFESTTGGTNLVTILLDKSLLDPRLKSKSLRVCYSSDSLIWTDRSGLLIGDDEPLGTPSLLPDCPKRATSAGPCQLKTTATSELFTVSFLSPTGATRGRT